MATSSAQVPRSSSTAAAPHAKPLLRGWLHVVTFFLAIPAGVLVVALAGSLTARVGAVVYAAGLVALFGVSGAYHRWPWSPAWLRRMQRLDHATIFVMIAGSYTPVCLLVLEGWVAALTLAAAWAGAALGVALAWMDGRRTTRLRSALYIVMGWLAVLATPQLVRHLSTGELALMATGGVLFTVGAVFLATRWPDPFPRIFGYHEIWHALVVAAAVCHLLAIGSVIRGAAA